MYEKKLEIKDRPEEVVLYACDSGHTLAMHGGLANLAAFARHKGLVLNLADVTLRDQQGVIMWRAAVYS